MYTVIVTEKPSVAREYAKVLGVSNSYDGYIEGKSKINGKNYKITWAVGHLVTLSYPEVYNESLKKWSLESLPFIPDRYRYEVLKDVKKQFGVIKKLYNSADTEEILYAGDSGREGIYIQMLIRQETGVKKGVGERVVWIDSQTEAEILRGIREAKPICAYEKLIDAAYMRAIEDYLVGINFSRALSCKFGYQYNRELGTDHYKPIAVGRVMTCVLGMIVRREREIKAFKETIFYKPTVDINGLSAKWKASESSSLYNLTDLYEKDGFLDKTKADAFINTLQGNPKIQVTNVEQKKESKKAPLLFNLAELQNECTKLYKISPDDTLSVAQSLYEKKLTTYPRTDARVLSTAVADEIDGNLKGLSNASYLADKASYILNNGMYKGLSKTKYVDDSKITDHYAIIPTGYKPSGLNELEQSVYELIVRRFLSIFYPEAEYRKTVIELTNIAYKEVFTLTEKILVNPGYLEIAGKSEDDESKAALGGINKGDTYDNPEYSLSEGKTNPPKRYTSGSMILAMENAGNLIEDEELRSQIKSCGIGTSATRAAILKKLIGNGYIRSDKKTQTLYPMLAGEKLCDIVEAHLASLLSPEMTASWEKGLAQIEGGSVAKELYNKKLNEYVASKVEEIKGAQAETMPEFVSEETTISCPYCGNYMKTTRKGYRCPNEDCGFFVGSIAGKLFTEEEVINLLNTGKSDLVTDFKSKKGDKFSAYVVFDKEEKAFSFEFPETSGTESDYKCPNCNSALIKNKWTYDCDCGFKLQTGIAHKSFTDKNIAELLSNGITGPIKGFKKKAGGTFSAKVSMDKETGALSFVFDK